MTGRSAEGKPGGESRPFWRVIQAASGEGMRRRVEKQVRRPALPPALISHVEQPCRARVTRALACNCCAICGKTKRRLQERTELWSCNSSRISVCQSVLTLQTIASLNIYASSL